ncbi:TetR/AcrR family transcriptional regulator C-terminal domain-containing protein [Dactylosporangium sp. CA-233914]|uniref:TetR/AcrR family transcriptional regulator C-terminal domain-containing protein n=1 Tax=Dactylosporangium sp. CA-233914 TaxID=3239934 RepID=UPI003D91928C
MARKAADIVAEMRRRIVAGELKPGDPVPSAKQIMADWSTSMAVAYHALMVMQEDGLATRVEGRWGRLVTPEAPGIAAAWLPPPPPGSQLRTRLVEVAIELADAEGLATMSMRKVALALDLTNVTVYRYVRDREHLELLMTDAIFAEHPPAREVTGDWRADLAQACRAQWKVYRLHPWLARTVSFKRPAYVPAVVAHTEWALRALAGLDVSAQDRSRLVATAMNLVRGNALNLPADAEARQAGAGRDDARFEAGLQRLLDGFARYAAA